MNTQSVVLYLRRIGVKNIIFAILALLIIIGAVSVLMNREFKLDPKFQETFDNGSYTEIINTLMPKVVRGFRDPETLKLLSAAYIQKAAAEPKSASQSTAYVIAYTDLIERDGIKDAEAQRLQGWAYFMRGDFERAEQSYNKALLYSNNQNLDAYVGLGLIAEKKGDTNGASYQFIRVTKLDPTNEPARLGLARYHLATKAPNEAIVEANKVITSTNKSVRAAAYETLGSAYLLKDDFKKAGEMYNMATNVDPNQVHSYVLYAESLIQGYFNYARLQDFKTITAQALEATEKALKVNPSYIYAHTTQYKIYLMQGERTKAAEVGKRIVSALPEDKVLSKAEKLVLLKRYSAEVPTVTVQKLEVMRTETQTKK